MMRTEPIDFSPKHDVLIRNSDGSFLPMDTPHYEVELIADGTWKILSDGDYFYLVEGSKEALLIDGGYGAGNVREFCQDLTEKPLRYIANTHDHFDHTANNAYFEAAYMSAATAPLATRPFPSFAGIDFPTDYEKRIIGEGYVFHLGGRDLEVFSIPDHAVGSLAFLDSKERILFSGDELGDPHGKHINGTVRDFEKNMIKLEAHRSEFDTCAGGLGLCGANVVDHYLSAADAVLSGKHGRPAERTDIPKPQPEYVDGHLVYDRHMPHPEDLPPDFGRYDPTERILETDGITLTYHINRIE